MKPIRISNKVKNLSTSELRNELDKLIPIVNNLDFDMDRDELKKELHIFEELIVESITRILYAKQGTVPLQNKIYDKVEALFSEQFSYNINRAISTLRRIREDYARDKEMTEGFRDWFIARIEISVRLLKRELEIVESMVPNHVSVDIKSNVKEIKERKINAKNN